MGVHEGENRMEFRINSVLDDFKTIRQVDKHMPHLSVMNIDEVVTPELTLK